MLAVCGMFFVGCTFGVRTCETAAECESGAVCTERLCVIPDDGGTTAGGGGGATGGGAGGGSNACTPDCLAWQNCTTGGCVDAVVSAVSPPAGATFNGGETVHFVFRVTNSDGGVWPAASVPAQTSGGATGPSMLMKNNNLFEGDFVLANATGVQAVRAGWAAANATISVSARVCSARCEPWQGCVADLDGGHCDDLGLSISWTDPTVGQQFGPRSFASVPLRLTATRGDGGAFAADVPYWIDGGATGVLSKQAAEWTGSLDAGATSGNRTVTAGWPGGPTAARSFEVVLSAPVVTLIVEPPPNRAAQDQDSDGVRRWKKSESALLRLESNRPLVPSSVVFSQSDVTRVGDAACSACGNVACLCFAMDLRTQALGSGVGLVAASVASGEDTLGNTFAVVGPVNVPVTRLKWARDMAPALSVSPLAVALKSSGVVVSGAKLGNGSALWNVTPDGGATNAWSSVSDTVTAGPLVGAQEDIYVATSSGAQALLVKNPGASQAIRCGVVSSATYDGDLALRAPGPTEVVYAVRSDGVLAPAQGSCVASVIDDGNSGSLAGRPTVAIQSDDVFVAGAGSAPVWKFLATAANPSPRGWVTTTTLFPANLFLIGAGIAGGGGGPTVGGVFGFVNPGGSLDGGITATATPGTSPGGAAVVGGTPANAVVYYGDNGGRVRRVNIAGGAAVTFASPASSAAIPSVRFSDRAPLLGAGGHVYVIGSDGVLRVLNATTLVEEWNWSGLFPASAPPSAISQLNLDIDRSVPIPCGPSQPGVLYVASTAAGVTKLVALLVDSPGLDRQAPWPRYQHNPANTGNSATGLTLWTCP